MGRAGGLPPERATDGAVDVRLLDLQSRIDETGLHRHVHQVTRILSPEGLTIAGNFAVGWQPTMSSVHVDKAVIRRGAVVVDVLKDGSAFQVLRREANLESMQIDGVLTAVMPLPDLRVGDEIETAWTIDANNPVLEGRSEDQQFFAPGPNFGRLYVRDTWPQARRVAYRVGGGLPKAAPIKGDTPGFVIDARDFSPPPIPDGAPTRFQAENRVDLTEFGGWGDVAATMRPLYADASRIGDGSPIKTEIARIAALSPDPKTRATEALKAVQRQIRYFARLDGLGGYRPETADSVWQARVGDCKGKTVLLLAMLRGLGIEAEAALVSVLHSDGVEGSLPLPSRFDHVLVRAIIDARTYWLDGARLGDRSVDSAPVPPYRWALPLDAQPRLVALVATDPALPVEDWRLDLDAREGSDKLAKATGTGIFRGERASELRTLVSIMSKDDRDKFLRKVWGERHDWLALDTVSYAYDEAAGEVRLGMTGSGTMDWNTSGGPPQNRYEANKARLGQDILVKRPEDQRNVPIVVAPQFAATRQTVLLPKSEHFAIDGDAIDAAIGPITYHREASLKDGRFEMVATTKSRGGEVSYADAVAADEKSDAVFAKQMFIKIVPEKTAVVAPGPLSHELASSIAMVLPAGSAKAVLLSGSISDEDYPKDAIAIGAQGTATASFEIGTLGRIGSCRIAESSGSFSLDDRTCALLRDRFIYRPAKAGGAAVPETRMQRVTWRLPNQPEKLEAFDVTYSYTVGIDGQVSDCRSTGLPPDKARPNGDCGPFPRTNMPLGPDGKPMAAHIIERHSRQVQPLRVLTR